MRIRELIVAVAFVLTVFVPSHGACAGVGAVEASSLRCELRQNPVGIDVVRPRLSWSLLSDERGQFQTAYQILVAADLADLHPDGDTLWNSGRVESDQSLHVVYGGAPLQSRQRCFWTVRVWDRDGEVSLWGAPSSPYEGYAAINPLGQFIGAVIMFFVLGFLPGWILAKIQSAAGVLRIPEEVELQGLDYAEHHAYEDAKAAIIAADKEELAARGVAAK